MTRASTSVRRAGLSGVGDTLLEAYSHLPARARGKVVHEFLETTGYLTNEARADQIMSSQAGPWVRRYLGHVNVPALLRKTELDQTVSQQASRMGWIAGGAFIAGLILG